mgnify:FL=1
MIVTLWGVRGSVPTPMTSDEYQDKLKRVLGQADGADLSDDDKIEAFIETMPREDGGVVGGNTTCVQVSDGETTIVCDAGSGIRPLGQKLMGSEFGKGQGEAHILFSHHHHDHTNGFPFFVPAYIPGNEIHFYGVHDALEERMVGLQVREYFPVPFHVMGSQKHFHQIEADVPFTIGEFEITPTQLNHPGHSYGYRFHWRDKVFVFASDSEYKNPSEEAYEHYIDFMSNADLLYFDGQYSLVEAFIKEDWGHSSAMAGVDFAVRSNVKQIVIGHHDPVYADVTILEMQQDAIFYREFNYPDAELEIGAAFEGDTFDLSD